MPVPMVLTDEIGTHSRMMYRYSRSLTKPLYFTMLGCYRKDEQRRVRVCGLLLTFKFFRRSISDYVCVSIVLLMPGRVRRTMISPNSALGILLSVISLMATVSPVAQLRAPAHKTSAMATGE